MARILMCYFGSSHDQFGLIQVECKDHPKCGLMYISNLRRMICPKPSDFCNQEETILAIPQYILLQGNYDESLTPLKIPSTVVVESCNLEESFVSLAKSWKDIWLNASQTNNIASMVSKRIELDSIISRLRNLHIENSDVVWNECCASLANINLKVDNGLYKRVLRGYSKLKSDNIVWKLSTAVDSFTNSEDDSLRIVNQVFSPIDWRRLVSSIIKRIRSLTEDVRTSNRIDSTFVEESQCLLKIISIPKQISELSDVLSIIPKYDIAAASSSSSVNSDAILNGSDRFTRVNSGEDVKMRLLVEENNLLKLSVRRSMQIADSNLALSIACSAEDCENGLKSQHLAIHEAASSRYISRIVSLEDRIQELLAILAEERRRVII